MFDKQQNKPQNRIDTLIGAGTRVDGSIHFGGGLRVDGEVNGDIIAEPGNPSTLVVSEHGKVTGKVSVTHLVANGKITGPVRASEYMELQSKAGITGDVEYKTMEIHLGATVSGKLVYINEASDKVVALRTGNTD